MIDYRTTVNLQSKGFQLVLASQRGGTFFCVYVELEPISNNKYEATFSLKNYRGLIKIGLDKVELVEREEGKFCHLKIYVNFSSKNTFKTTLELNKGEVLICEREDVFRKENSDFIVSNDEYINLNQARVAQYSVEKKLAEQLIKEVKGQKALAASRDLCVIGFSKLT